MQNKKLSEFTNKEIIEELQRRLLEEKNIPTQKKIEDCDFSILKSLCEEYILLITNQSTFKYNEYKEKIEYYKSRIFKSILEIIYGPNIWIWLENNG